MKRLGLDLGTASLGWAILDDEKLENAPFGSDAPSPIDCGVVIFPEGMDRDKSNNLNSPAADRRMKRAARRLIFRRKLRKFHILKVLIEAGMCPLSAEGLQQWKDGRYPVSEEAFMTWLASGPEDNPYRDRKLAAEGPVDPLVLGRAIYHIAQRRGFKSSKKERLQELQSEIDREEGIAGKAKKKQSESELTQTKKAIDDLSAEMGDRTLGQFFYECYRDNVKIRTRKTGRIEHYEKEYEVIRRHQPELLGGDLGDRIHDILFFQRPLKIQRHLVGWCSLDKGHSYGVKNEATGRFVTRQGYRYRRCSVSHPTFEYFRALCFINNLAVSDIDTGDRIRKEEGRALTAEERVAVLEKLTRKTAAEVAKVLPKGLTSNYRKSEDAPIMPMTASLNQLGIKPEDRQKALNGLMDFDDIDKLIAWSKKSFGLSDAQARRFAAISVSTDRAQYSLHAIRKIIPYLEKGFVLRKAVFCANLDLIIPDFEKNCDEVLKGLLVCEANFEYEREQRKQNKIRAIHPLESYHYFDYLNKIWNVTQEDFRKLYVDVSETNTNIAKLPPVSLGSIRNPLACRSLTILRRLVNTLREKGKIDYDTRINIELSHTVNSSNLCRAIEKYQTERATMRAEARTKLEEILKETGSKVTITDDLILRYLLWEEQEHYSVYTGQPISAVSMLEHCDIEHTLPRSRGGTGRMENLTLCESHYNRDIKKGLLPTECPNATDEWTDAIAGATYPAIGDGKVLTAWEQRLESMDKLLRKKPRRGGDPAAYAEARQKYLVLKEKRNYLAAKISMFRIPAGKVNEGGFIPRQMADTGIITRQAVRFLKQRYTHVYSTNGAATAFARKAWGLQSEDEKKSRIDHTHHAVDAMVIAALDAGRFAAICKTMGDDCADWNYAAVCPAPYPHFGEMIHHAAEGILVRHLPQNCQVSPFAFGKDGRTICGIRGSLHNDTLYGRILVNGKPTTVIRKTLAGASEADLKKWAQTSVDKYAGRCLLEQMDAYVKAGIPKSQLGHQDYWITKKCDGSQGTPLKKMRVTVAKPSNPDVLRDQVFMGEKSVYVSGGDLLRLDFVKDAKGRLVPKSISELDCAQGTSPTQSDGIEFSLHPMMLALAYETSPEELKSMTPPELSKRLYQLRKFESSGRLTLRFHREARRATVLSEELLAAGKKKAGESKINYQIPERLLLVSTGTYLSAMLFENIHFRLSMDGDIEWLF